jgi:hypothetical protein
MSDFFFDLLHYEMLTRRIHVYLCIWLSLHLCWFKARQRNFYFYTRSLNLRLCAKRRRNFHIYKYIWRRIHWKLILLLLFLLQPHDVYYTLILFDCRTFPASFFWIDSFRIEQRIIRVCICWLKWNIFSEQRSSMY